MDNRRIYRPAVKKVSAGILRRSGKHGGQTVNSLVGQVVAVEVQRSLVHIALALRSLSNSINLFLPYAAFSGSDKAIEVIAMK
jgi:hypothetical protein